jgi:Glycosyl hydrolase family 3 N terminal domain
MDPREVSRLGAASISAQQRTGVAATAKHFPGLGAAATNQNTDEGPVTLNLSLDTIRRVDEVPYPAAIQAGVELVMSSWAVYPALDPPRPAGLSPTVIQGELRARLGFRWGDDYGRARGRRPTGLRAHPGARGPCGGGRSRSPALLGEGPQRGNWGPGRAGRRARERRARSRTPHHTRVHARASASAADSCAPGLDDGQESHARGAALSFRLA